jgi:hypothetical protein
MARVGRACVLLALAANIVALRLDATPLNDALMTVAVDYPQPLPEELATPDKLIFDHQEFEPTCRDLQRFLQERPEFKISKKVMASHLSSRARGGAKDFVNHCMTTAQSRPLTPPKRENAIIDFLHISKAGGTFYCACGNKNARNSNRGINSGTNCHYLSADRPYWENNSTYVPPFARKPPTKIDCPAKANKMKEQGLDFEGNENFLPNDGLCPDSENVFIMRDPMHRIISHLDFIHDRTNLTHTAPITEISVDTVLARWPRLANNYVARMLGGEEVESLSILSSGNTSVLQKAEQRLDEFDTVFIMDKGFTKAIEKRHGWNCSGVMGRTSTYHGGTKGRVEAVKAAWPAQDWQRLLDYNEMDRQLYKTAQILNFAWSIL